MAKIKIVSRLTEWVKKNPLEALVLGAIILIAAFLRLYKISEYMTFLGDEGRDAIIVRRLLVYADPILIGPGTSIGNMYLGPAYYYMMAPALFLARFSPVGPAIQVALLGVVTTAFVYFVGKKWFGMWAAITAALLYAISPTVIIYSRSSWNPNIMPFFSLLTIYSLWKIWQERRWNWIFVLVVSFAMVLQSHYLGSLLAPVIVIFWLATLIKAKGEREKMKGFIKKSVVAAILFLVLMSPLVIFDARHGWMNFSAMKKFFTERQTTISARPWTGIPKAWPVFNKAVTRLVAGRNETIGSYLSVALLAGIVLSLASILYNNKARKKIGRPILLLLAWLGFAILGLSLYKQEIYDHYYGFFFPAPFLLLGGLSQTLIEKAKVFRKIPRLSIYCLLFISFSVLVYANIKVSPLKGSPNKQLQRSESVAEEILKESKGERFNLAVIAERNYEDGYQYFLEKEGAPVIDIDAQRPETITEQLFVVCELPKEKCDPTHNPKAQVASFGWTKIEDQREVFGIILYKLVHSK